ncbi:hypothetical protein [Streptomyces sp. NPDC005283]|uniref:hypothetical protein n=1 Tax=Streptomyces sp. NPDC005283 TaxID=3156871 RepID=UPI0034564063
MRRPCRSTTLHLLRSRIHETYRDAGQRLSLAALALTVGPAQAGTAPADSETRAIAFSDQEQDIALEFWTDARLNAAKEMAAPAAAPEAPRRHVVRHVVRHR